MPSILYELIDIVTEFGVHLQSLVSILFISFKKIVSASKKKKNPVIKTKFNSLKNLIL